MDGLAGCARLTGADGDVGGTIGPGHRNMDASGTKRPGPRGGENFPSRIGLRRHEERGGLASNRSLTGCRAGGLPAISDLHGIAAWSATAALAAVPAWAGVCYEATGMCERREGETLSLGECGSSRQKMRARTRRQKTGDEGGGREGNKRRYDKLTYLSSQVGARLGPRSQNVTRDHVN
jgi:hypothetical protein